MSLIRPTEAWQTAKVKLANPTDFRVDENFYVVPTAGRRTTVDNATPVRSPGGASR